MSDPRKPVGQSARAKWYRDVHEKVFRQSRIGTVAGQRVINGTQGRVVVVSRTSGGGAPPANMYVLATPTALRQIVVEDDYLVCRELVLESEEGGFVVGTEDIYIAKQYHHRCSITSTKLLDIEWTYTYDRPAWDSGSPDLHQNVFRYAENPDEYSEEQRIVPPWVPSRTEGDPEEFIPGDVIYAIETTGTGVIRTYLDDEEVEQTEELTLLDVGSSRQWAKLSIFAVP